MTVFRITFSTHYQPQGSAEPALPQHRGGRGAQGRHPHLLRKPCHSSAEAPFLRPSHGGARESSWRQGGAGLPWDGAPVHTPFGGDGWAPLSRQNRIPGGERPQERNQRDTGKNTQGAHRGRNGNPTENRPPLLNLGRTRPSDRSPELVTGGGSSSNGQAAEREGREGHQDTRMLEPLDGQPPVRNRIRSRVGLQREEVCSWLFTAVLTRSSRLGPHGGR